MTIHAERAVIKKLGDETKLRGAVLIVVRIGADGELRESRPCHACQMHLEKCMREHGLERVYFSSETNAGLL